MAKSNKNQYSNVKVHVFNPDTQTLSVEDVIEMYSNQIETVNGVYTIEDSLRYFDEVNANMIYVFNADIPAKIESNNLKKLRRSTALTRIFDYDIKQKTDLMKFVPYVIIMMLIIFK